MGRAFLLSMALILSPAVLLPACDSSGIELESRTLRVGCGSCQFGHEGHAGCYWAAEVGDRIVPMGGPGLPKDHDDHAPDGICNVTREAAITGTLHDEHLVVTRMELGPVDESSRTASPHSHAH